MLKKCLYCEKEFNVSPSRVNIKKFCSLECKKLYRQSLRETLICPYCKKEFTDLKCNERVYCSKECADKSMVKLETYICSTCRKKFQREPYRVKSDKIYCSNECKFKGMENRETRLCSICSKPITRPKSLFREIAVCSSECLSLHRRLISTGENSPVFNSRKMRCLHCGKEFYEPLSRVNNNRGKFCCRQCLYDYLDEHSAYDYTRGKNWKTQRLKALIRDNFTCQQCGSKYNLQVHHKVPFVRFKDYRIANDLKNLITLCISCHSKQNPR